MPTIESNIPVAPPAWAVLERRLIDTMSEAAVRYADRYTRPGGTLIWRTTGTLSWDQIPESFYNLPLLYALGGDDRLKELSFRLWHAGMRQLRDDFHLVKDDFPAQSDWFHIGEGLLFFYHLALADPTDHEMEARAVRFAALYLDQPNYDPKLRIIRSPKTGSAGPYLGEAANASQFAASKAMSSYGLPLQDLPGIRSYDDLKDQEKARRMGVAIQERLYRGDVPMNLAATSLMTHAYLFTGDVRYAEWVKDYTRAWMERTRANGGLTPDNVGLSGRVGETHNGKWWGGSYGWMWPHGFYSFGQGLHIAGANAQLLTAGDGSYLELLRSNLRQLIAAGKTHSGAFLVPYKRGDHGWFHYQPLERQMLASLWFSSLEARDWELIEKVRLASRTDWHVATKSPFPNRAYGYAPETLEDCLNCDVEGLADWNQVMDLRNKEDRSHEAPWLRFLAGANPDYPETILSSSLGISAWRWDQIRRDVLLFEYDPRAATSVERSTDLTKLWQHHWQTVNPVTTEALVQLTMGAPQLMYNGGLLHASVRYFDPGRKRPGLPKDIAALVRKLSASGLVLELVNLSPFEDRDVIVQAGTFGEHQFTSVRYRRRTDKEPAQPDHFGRPIPVLAEERAEVGAKAFQVRLPAGTGLTLELGVRRFANKPSYAFPWHGERIPVQ